MSKAERGGVSGGRAKESGGGAQADGGKGEFEEGGGWTLYSWYHSGQQPTRFASGQCAYSVYVMH